MKQSALFLSLFFSAFAVADVTDRAVDVDDFESIHLKGSMDVEVIQASSYSVSVETEDNWQQWVKIERHGDTLVMKMDEERPGSWFSNEPAVAIRITMPYVEEILVQGSGEVRSPSIASEALELRVDGSGDIEVTEVAVPILDLNVNGSGDIKLWKVSSEQTTAEVDGSGDIKITEGFIFELASMIRGSGDIKVAGESERAEIAIYGSGDFDGRGLTTKEADVIIYGSGDVWLDTELVLNQTVRGSGDIHITR
jgi:hypothetical protein